MDLWEKQGRSGWGRGKKDDNETRQALLEKPKLLRTWEVVGANSKGRKTKRKGEGCLEEVDTALLPNTQYSADDLKGLARNSKEGENPRLASRLKWPHYIQGYVIEHVRTGQENTKRKERQGGGGETRALKKAPEKFWIIRASSWKGGGINYNQFTKKRRGLSGGEGIKSFHRTISDSQLIRCK